MPLSRFLHSSPRSLREFLRVYISEKRLHLLRCLVSGVTSFSRVGGKVAARKRDTREIISLGQIKLISTRFHGCPFPPLFPPGDWDRVL